MSEVILCPTAKKDNKGIVSLRKKLPRCPICKKKAFLSHDVVDRADMGYSVGCPAYRTGDGVHSINAAFYGFYTKEEAAQKWTQFCFAVGDGDDHMS